MYERVRAQLGLRETCTEWHCEKNPGGIWSRGTADAYGLVYSGTGVPAPKAECRKCGARSGAIPYDVFKTWNIKPEQIEWVISHHTANNVECVVVDCERIDVEWHHFAPRNTFGSDAEMWPCLPVCRGHHREWHQRMDGYHWHSARVAA